MDEVFEEDATNYDIFFSPKPDRLGDVSADVKLSVSTRSSSNEQCLIQNDFFRAHFLGPFVHIFVP
jgi:hypothetical protein